MSGDSFSRSSAFISGTSQGEWIIRCMAVGIVSSKLKVYLIFIRSLSIGEIWVETSGVDPFLTSSLSTSRQS